MAFFLFLASLLAFALSTVSGGGAGLLLLPVLARSLPGLAVPAALTVGTATSTVSKLALFRRHVSWAITRRFVPGAVPGVLFGGLLLRYLNPLYFEVIIGLFLLSNLKMLRPGAGAREPQETTAARAPGWRLVGIGALAGFLSGLTGAVGLLFNKFYFRHGLSRDEVIATRAANELLLHLLKLALYAGLGLLTRPVLAAGAAVALGAVLATTLTKRYIQYLPERAFRRLGYAAMVLSGGFMLTSATQALRQTENLRASLALVGRDLEITGWWRTGSVTLEFELDESPSIEQPVALNRLPAPTQAAALAAAAGRPILKVEEVWQFRRHFYEVYLNDGGRVRSVDVLSNGS